MPLTGALTALGIRTFSGADRPSLHENPGGLTEILQQIDALLRAAGLATSGVVPLCSVTHSLNQSIANAVATALAFDTERIDTDLMHDVAVNNERLTFKTAGTYLVGAAAELPNGTGGTGRLLQIAHSPSGVVIARNDRPLGGALSCVLSVVALRDMAVNDYVRALVYHDAGAAINVQANPNYSPEFWAVRVG